MEEGLDFQVELDDKKYLEGIQLFFSKQYADVVKVCNSVLQEIQQNLNSINEEKQKTILIDRKLAFLRLQSASYFELEFFRKCISTCDEIINIYPADLRSYIIKGKSLKLTKKSKSAKTTWINALQKCDYKQDLFTIKELVELINGSSLSSSPSEPPSSSPSPNPPSPSQSPQSSQSSQTSQTSSSIESNPKSKINSNSLASAVSKDSSLSSASKIVAERGMVQHGSGNIVVDERIAIGYLLVNTGKFANAIETFTKLINDFQNNPPFAAFIGRGTAYALSGDLTKGIIDFSKSIEIDGKSPEGWKRRAQARAAKGSLSEALSDLTQTIALTPNDADAYHQRALVYYRQKNYLKAIKDLNVSLKIDSSIAPCWNQFGLALTAIGKPQQGVEAQKKALELDPKFSVAYMNMGQAYKEWGKFSDAIQSYTKAIKMEKKNGQAHFLRAMAYFSHGQHAISIDDYSAAISGTNEYIDAQYMRGVVQQALGRYEKAIEDFDACTRMDKTYASFYHKEISLFYASNIDRSVYEFNFDHEIDPYFKEAWCKRLPPSSLSDYRAQKVSKEVIKSAEVKSGDCSIDRNKFDKLIEIADRIGPNIQLNCAGYMPNKRQWRMCGLAVIELAQHLRRCWRSSPSSPYLVKGEWNSAFRQEHEFGWRDMYDIIVRWRQVSEPMDPVVWVDLLSPEQFYEGRKGFGSHTPILTGQTKVVRYYPMFKRSFDIMKNLIGQVSGLSSDDISQFQKCKNVKEAHALIRRDFFVVTPYYSVKYHHSKIYEGTRLTLQKSGTVEGYEFSIRTPGTPSRWQEYTEELEFIFSNLKAEIQKPSEEFNIDAVSDWILTLTFCWYNFMPLARGTAACGYIGLLAMFLSIGYEISSGVPKEFQVDWEGILTPKAEDFVKTLKSWMYPARSPSSLIDELPDIISDSSLTFRTMIELLNASHSP